MASTHVAHDVNVGSHCVLSHGATSGRACRGGRWAVGRSILRRTPVLPHRAPLHHRRIQRSYPGMFSRFRRRSPAREIQTFGANKIGLERRGFPTEAIEGLQTAFRLLTRRELNTSASHRAHPQRDSFDSAELDEVLAFIVVIATRVREVKLYGLIRRKRTLPFTCSRDSPVPRTRRGDRRHPGGSFP